MKVKVGDRMVVSSGFSHDFVKFKVGYIFTIVCEDSSAYGCEFEERWSDEFHYLYSNISQPTGWWIDKWKIRQFAVPLKLDDPSWEV